MIKFLLQAVHVLAFGDAESQRSFILRYDPVSLVGAAGSKALRASVYFACSTALDARSKWNARAALLEATRGQYLMIDNLLDIACEYIEQESAREQFVEFVRERTNISTWGKK